MENTLLFDKTPGRLRKELTETDSDDLSRRRAIIGLSLAGIASMTAVTLLQTGIVRHLPDPPIPGFNSDKVNLSETAYTFGLPDGPVTLASFALNLPLAALGGADRARKYPWIPALAAGKAVVEAAVSAWFFYRMPAKEKAWCGYCIAGALACFSVAALTVPEALKAIGRQ